MAKRKQQRTKNLNVPLTKEAWVRFYRIQQRIEEMHGSLSCSQPKTIEYIINHCPLGDLPEPGPPDEATLARINVPLPPARREHRSRV